MKTLALTLLPLALGTTLLAQSNIPLYTQDLKVQNGVASVTISSNQSEQPEAALNETTAFISVACASEEEHTNSGFASANKPKKKKSNYNKAYSIAGEVSYNTGIGLHSGAFESGLSVKHFFRGNTAIEGIISAGLRYRGIRLTALYEVQKPLGTNGFYWYWGIGGHTGVFSKDYWNQSNCNDGSYEQDGKLYNCDDSRLTAGIDGILGLEYQFTERPFTIGLGIKPSIDLLGRSNHYGDGAFAFRYVF